MRAAADATDAFRAAIAASGLRPPGVIVPPGQELIRLSLMATHTDAQIDFALDKLAKVAREFSVI